jgi:hypothetical protein
VSDEGIWWSAKVGGLWFMWPESLRAPELAKMLRTSKVKAKAQYDATPGRRCQRVALILTRAATGRIVSLEDIDLHAATEAELALWRRHHHVADVMRGTAPEVPVEQPALFA